MSQAPLLRRVTTSLLGLGLLAAGLAGSAYGQCRLNSPSGTIKHVVYVEFDNVHFTRDNPNVPSDLEQMPNLLNFITQHGTLDAGDHTVLISHTANDILTTQTGLYSDHTGIFIANSFGVFSPTSSGENGLFPSSFFYWTDKVSDINAGTDDNTFALTTPSGQNVSAPWVPFTRAGCTVGAFSTANIVLERAPFDVYKVFGGPTSPQGMESGSNQNNDFIGVSIHCALGDPICQSNPTLGVVGVSDTLPDEPGGYSGYQALFGLKYINPALTGSPTGSITDYHGVPLTGFNQLDFDPVPAQSLAVIETMLKKGIPVVYAYIADAHDNHEETTTTTEGTFGPGEAPYVDQLADYNSAFATFFLHLKEAGIDETNTLFIFTPDEGDHFVGGAPSPANCDGAKIEHNGNVVPDIPCTYGTNGVGELDINLLGLTQAAGDPTAYSIHFDDAATTYVNGQPLPSSSTVRTLEQTMAGLSAVNPHTGLSESLLGTGLGPDLQGAIVDPAAMQLLHMNTVADPNREPTFTFFGNPNFFFETAGSTTPVVGTGFAWNHGDIQPEIARTFIAIAGPGVKNLGVTEPHDFFTDHVDLRPTMMTLLGLTDDYQHDGRTIVELLDPKVLPSSLRAHSDTLLRLGQIYKKINAPFGELSKHTLAVSTYGITSTSAGDVVYNNLENLISDWTLERDGLAAEIKAMLEAAEFNGVPIDEKVANDLIVAGEALLDQARFCANHPATCGS
jgi:hypothetical protein